MLDKGQRREFGQDTIYEKCHGIFNDHRESGPRFNVSSERHFLSDSIVFLDSMDFATHTATANTLIYFRFVVDACSELNLRQANCLSSIFYLKFRFDTQ